MNVRNLTSTDIDTPEFWHLLWLSSEYDDAKLRRVHETELPRLTIIGVCDDDVIVGFAAFKASTHSVVLEYIAVHEAAQGKGVGGALVDELRRRYPRASIAAQTDDDAVGFYRSLGFAVSQAPLDRRWPGRQRYDCVLPPQSRC